MDSQSPTSFALELLSWHESQDRELPWKSTNDPYVIYVSEIILQQTRVDQGTPYFLKFIERFPGIESLAEASEDEVFALWKGLGYYSRARNMMKTAQIIKVNYQGKFPQNYEELLNLPGIGPYTAAAIASFAFKLPYAVVDGNVIRVVSRLNAVSEQIEKQGKKIISDWVSKQIIGTPADRFNQAIMDLGALVCKPKNPLCKTCPFELTCNAHKSGTEQLFPVKKTKAKKKTRYFHFFLIKQKDQILIKKRYKKDIWMGLYELPCIETEEESHEANQLLKGISETIAKPLKAEIVKTASYKQELSHQRIYAQFYENKSEWQLQEIKPPYYLVERKNLNNYAFPKVLDWYLDENSIYLIN